MKEFVIGMLTMFVGAIQACIKNIGSVGKFITDMFDAKNRGIMHLVALIIFAFILYAIFPLPPIFPIEKSLQSKFAHLIIGILSAYLFWHIAEHHHSAHHINPFDFILGCLWGASGIFLIRVGLNLFGIRDVPYIGSLLWAAFPDWDIVILGIGSHRNFFFHSEIIPILVMAVAVQQKQRWLRDIGMGLAIGVASHLLWDMVSVANWPYSYIRHLDGIAGSAWVLSNAIIGVFFAYYLIGRQTLPIETHQDRIDD